MFTQNAKEVPAAETVTKMIGGVLRGPNLEKWAQIRGLLVYSPRSTHDLFIDSPPALQLTHAHAARGGPILRLTSAIPKFAQYRPFLSGPRANSSHKSGLMKDGQAAGEGLTLRRCVAGVHEPSACADAELLAEAIRNQLGEKVNAPGLCVLSRLCWPCSRTPRSCKLTPRRPSRPARTASGNIESSS